MSKLTVQSTSKLSAWTEPHAALGISPMDHLFNRMEGQYLSKWRREFPDANAIANWRESWAEAFAEEGITFDEIKRGIVACRRMFDWPPTLPEFIKACRPALDYEAAYHEAVEQMARRHNPVMTAEGPVSKDVWSHPAIYWAAGKLGTDLALGYGAVKKRWKLAIDEAMASPRGEVPVLRHALPAPGKCSVPPEEAKRRIADILARINVAPKERRQRNAQPVSREAIKAAEAELRARKGAAR